MKLGDFIFINKKRYSSAARELAVTPQAVRGWCLGDRIPSPEWMTRIYEWSNGHVTPNDFYDLPAAPREADGHSDGEFSPSSVSPATVVGEIDAHHGKGFSLPFARVFG